MVSQINSISPFVGYMESRIGGRAENQDSCGYSDTPSGLLVLVCDGMGGGPAGKTASFIATQTIIDSVKKASSEDRKTILRDAISEANSELIRKQEENLALKGMGTTVVAVLLNEESAVVAHVGDSRLYKLRDGFKIFRTRDHSMVGEMVRRKELTEEQARLSAQSNIITRALGTTSTCKPDIEEIAFEKGDRFVLCSDGIWGAFPEPQLVKKCSRKMSLQGVVESLAMETDDSGKAKGGFHDNLTIIIIQTKIDSKKRDKMTKLAKRIILALLALLIVCFGSIFYLSKNLSLVSVLKSQIEDLNNSISERNKTIDELNDRLSQKDRDLKIAEERVKTAKAQKATAEAQRVAAEVQKDAANAKAAGAEKRAKEAEAKANSGRGDKKKTNGYGQVGANGAYNSIIADLESEKNVREKSKQDAQRILSRLKSKLNEKIKQLTEAQKNQLEKKSLKAAIVKDYSTQICRSSNRNYCLLPVAQDEIQQLIDKLKKL